MVMGLVTYPNQKLWPFKVDGMDLSFQFDFLQSSSFKNSFATFSTSHVLWMDALIMNKHAPYVRFKFHSLTPKMPTPSNHGYVSDYELYYYIISTLTLLPFSNCQLINFGIMLLLWWSFKDWQYEVKSIKSAYNAQPHQFLFFFYL